jgi:membrane-associated protease RseP (regulator of RpoE activity)
MTNAVGVGYESLDEGSAAMTAGMPASGTITAIGGESITDTKDLLANLEGLKPGDEITLTIAETDYTAVLGENPTDTSKAYLGVKTVTNETVRKDSVPAALYFATIIAMTTAFWTYIISLGIGIANLLPIGPIDGGRMILLALESRFEKERARGIWARGSTILIILVVILVAVPILKAIF